MSILVRPICPRCTAMFRINDYGGLSRIDNYTRICSPCEADEAIEDYFGELTDIKHWPVKRPWSQGDEHGNVSDDR